MALDCHLFWVLFGRLCCPLILKTRPQTRGTTRIEYSRCGHRVLAAIEGEWCSSSSLPFVLRENHYLR